MMRENTSNSAFTHGTNRRLNSILLCAAVTCSGIATVASDAAVLWDANGGVGGSWHTPENWNPDDAPTVVDDVNILTLARSSAENPITLTSSTSINALAFAGGSGGTNAGGYLSISADLSIAGKLSSYRGLMDITHTAGHVSANNIYFGERVTTSTYRLSGTGSLSTAAQMTLSRGDSNATVEFLQSGGAVNVGTNLTLSAEGGAGATGTSLYQLSGGTLTIDGYMRLGWKTSNATFEQSAGQTRVVGTVMLGTDASSIGNSLRLSDAADFATSSTLTVGSNGVGKVILDGSRTGNGADLATGGNFSLGAGSAVAGIIDLAAIATPDAMRLIDVTGNVSFANGSLLLPEFDLSASPTAGTWTLMTWTGSATNNGLSLDPATATGWSFNLDEIDRQLTVTYVPEPTGLALMTATGLLLGARRRQT